MQIDLAFPFSPSSSFFFLSFFFSFFSFFSFFFGRKSESTRWREVRGKVLATQMFVISPFMDRLTALELAGATFKLNYLNLKCLLSGN